MTADQFFARRFASKTTGASPLPSSSPSPYASSSSTSFDASASCSASSQELLPAESSPLPVGYFPGEVDPAWGVGIKLTVPLLSQRQVEGLFAWLHLHPSVIHLAYPSCYLSVELAPVFARLLQQNTTLLSLQLSSLSPSSSAQSGLLMVLRSLAFNSSLQYLDLRATGLETEACELLAASLRLNSSLRVLYLDSLCRRRLGLLAGGLKRNTGLQVLHIHSLSLKHLEPSLDKLLKAAARNPTLLHLHLPDLSRSIT
ncbi:MAG: hypothetical protein Q8P67_07560 [archaeon]|nr:hypothetical protein [archaeon]